MDKSTELRSNTESAEHAVASILKPLARLMIDHGLPHGHVAEMLKLALVQESICKKEVGNREPTDTRVALLTGVHRKDVRRLRASSATLKVSKSVASIPAAVIGRWISDPRFLNSDQTPRSLPRSPKVGVDGELDFPDLVAEVNRDLSSRSVLDELERLGAVVIFQDGQVKLVSQAFIPQESPIEQFGFLGTNVGDHLSSAVYNLMPKRSAPAMLEQSAFSELVSTEQAEALHEYARKLWVTAMQKFIAAATIAEQRSKNGNTQYQRVRFGAYFYDESKVKSIKTIPNTKTIQRDKEK